MRCIYKGHCYILNHLDGDGTTTLQFVQRKPFHEPREGVTNQEVLRAVIDRVKELDKETTWEGNAEILYHLRMALALHESRAILRHIEKHGFEIEHIATGPDGHLVFVKDT